jgi:uncharacterized membrane protein YqgA involved in biofilm formation
MIGTLLNVAGVLVGGGLGMIIGSKLSDDLQDALMKVTGVCVLFLGVAGSLERMLVFSDQGVTTQGGMLMIISVTLGTLLGELLNIELSFEHLGHWLKKVSKSEGDSRFIDAFLTTSLTICIGAMAILGAITEGLTGDYSILAAKAVLDLIIVLVVTVSKGKGALFSALPLFLLQGSITLLAQFLAPLVTDTVLSNISLVGNVLIFCVGLNLVFGKMIRVANMLPAVVVAIVFSFLN